MIIYLIICNILFIPFIIDGKSVPVSKIDNKTIISNNTSKKDEFKAETMISEGGSISVDPNSLTSLLENSYTIPISIDTELSRNKKKSVVPKKGVEFNPSEENTNVNISLIPPNLSPTKAGDISSNSNSTLDVNKSKLHDTNVVNNTSVSNITKVHKPLVLSYEALARLDKLNNVDTNDNGPTIKVNAMKAGSHPAMIMPIVITILIVPMFAVVGYMALKRGQEAWKNRHYKRMDFLLDGMYND